VVSEIVVRPYSIEFDRIWAESLLEGEVVLARNLPRS